MPYCPRCGYAYTVTEIPKPKVEPKREILISYAPQGCWSGHHTYHTYVPWQHGTPYDKECLICKHPAAWVSGSGIALCDCCAQDWSEWCDKNVFSKNLSLSGKGKNSSWGLFFAQFQGEMQKGG